MHNLFQHFVNSIQLFSKIKQAFPDNSKNVHFVSIVILNGLIQTKTRDKYVIYDLEITSVYPEVN